MMTSSRYFQSQVFDKESEMSHLEALKRGSHIECYFLNEKPSYAEFVEDERIYYVFYYNRRWPDRDLVNQHLSRYDVPFEIVTPSLKNQDVNIVQHFAHKKTGELESITEKYLNDEDNYLREVSMDKDRNVIGILEYEYNAAGDLKYTRELRPDGAVISEYDCEYLEYT